ncbi:aspartate kinase [Adlercreutzia murintestinalis]|uniref:aspartate kinase n=1 Tax=Adlercreutzia murintestinalis TaxID=2941325 RepID=UPI002041B937|nr:aspartate kinase [Adlercreutzia murintestinalis]
MALIVAKFGGTSVASPERIKNVAKRLAAMREQGDRVVAVVSAMGKTTDELMGLANAVSSNPPARELDRLLSTGEHVSMTLLALALDAMGVPAISFTGRQAGIETNGTHNKARIVKVHNERILEALAAGLLPVVAGFQGIDANGDITTLGRGGSDTTAVAVAWGIGADACEIYSDVDGVYTTDPRVAPRARKLSQISYDDMLELSSAGSGVLQSRAVEFAKKWGVVIHSRSAFSDALGTYIKEEPQMEEAVITGIAHDTSEVKVTVRHVPDAVGVAAKVFTALAARAVNMDMIIQNTSLDGATDISFTCPASDLPRAQEALETIVPQIGAESVDVEEDVAKISLVGTGMKSSPGVSAKAFDTLGANNINIIAISTSPIRLSMVIDAAEAQRAVQLLHTAFDLDSESVFEETQLSAEEIAAKMQKGR